MEHEVLTPTPLADAKVKMTRVHAIKVFFGSDRAVQNSEIMGLKPDDRLELGDLALAALGAELQEVV